MKDGFGSWELLIARAASQLPGLAAKMSNPASASNASVPSDSYLIPRSQLRLIAHYADLMPASMPSQSQLPCDLASALSIPKPSLSTYSLALL